MFLPRLLDLGFGIQFHNERVVENMIAKEISGHPARSAAVMFP